VVREEVQAFVDLGPFPPEDVIGQDDIEERDRRLNLITAPLTDEEAILLLNSFGPDDCYGMAWTVLHLIETSPTSAVLSEPPPDANEWLIRLWKRYQNSLE
jgi:hypothetical protein